MAGPSVSLDQFTRRLSDLMNGGMTLHRSLQLLGDQTQKNQEKHFIQNLRHEIEQGQSFSQALTLQGRTCPPLYIGLVRAGESSGTLEETLDELAQFLDEQKETQRQIRAALLYPGFLLGLSLLVCVFLVGFVIPRFEFLFEELGQALPWPTQLLIQFTAFIKTSGWGLLAVAVFCFGLIQTNDRWRQGARKKVFQLPIVAPFFQNTSLHRWAKAMATLLHRGFSVLEALSLSQQTLPPGEFKEALDEVARSVARGDGLSHALAKHPLFPPVVSELVSAGEESDRLDATFSRLADMYGRESKRGLQMGTRLLEPFLIVGMGLGVGFVALAMLLPIFEMGAHLK